jgi:hypothetical protein
LAETDGEEEEKFAETTPKRRVQASRAVRSTRKRLIKPEPSVSKGKLAQIGEAVLQSCHAPGVTDQQRKGVLELLIGKVSNASAQTVSGCGRRTLQKRKNDAKYKVKKHITKSEINKKVFKANVGRHINDGELLAELKDHASESCRFTADGTPLLTVF